MLFHGTSASAVVVYVNFGNVLELVGVIDSNVNVGQNIGNILSDDNLETYVGFTVNASPGIIRVAIPLEFPDIWVNHDDFTVYARVTNTKGNTQLYMDSGSRVRTYRFPINNNPSIWIPNGQDTLVSRVQQRDMDIYVSGTANIGEAVKLYDLRFENSDNPPPPQPTPVQGDLSMYEVPIIDILYEEGHTAPGITLGNMINPYYEKAQELEQWQIAEYPYYTVLSFLSNGVEPAMEIVYVIFSDNPVLNGFGPDEYYGPRVLEYEWTQGSSAVIYCGAFVRGQLQSGEKLTMYNMSGPYGNMDYATMFYDLTWIQYIPTFFQDSGIPVMAPGENPVASVALSQYKIGENAPYYCFTNYVASSGDMEYLGIRQSGTYPLAWAKLDVARNNMGAGEQHELLVDMRDILEQILNQPNPPEFIELADKQSQQKDLEQQLFDEYGQAATDAIPTGLPSAVQQLPSGGTIEFGSTMVGLTNLTSFITKIYEVPVIFWFVSVAFAFTAIAVILKGR